MFEGESCIVALSNYWDFAFEYECRLLSGAIQQLLQFDSDMLFVFSKTSDQELWVDMYDSEVCNETRFEVRFKI